MPRSRRTKQKKSTSGSTQRTRKQTNVKRKRRRSSPEIVIEEETTRVVPVTRTEVRAEPVTLARALGEAAVVDKVEPQVTRVVKRRRRA